MPAFHYFSFKQQTLHGCLPEKMKNWQNAGYTTMLLKAGADQQAFAYEWCGIQQLRAGSSSMHNLLMLLGWNWNFIQLGSALTDSPALWSSPCYHKQRIRSFWRAGWDKRWQATHLLGQLSIAEIPSFKRKAKKMKLLSWTQLKQLPQGYLQWMWKMNRWLTGMAHQTCKNKINFGWGEN